jgi:hypothetical protein
MEDRMMWRDRLKTSWNDGPGFDSLLDDPHAPHPVANRNVCNGGGDKPQGGQSFSTSNTTATTAPSPYIQSDLKGLTDRLRSFDTANPNAPGYYPSGTVAAPSPFSTSARDQTWGYAQSGIHELGGNFAPSLDYLKDAAGGKYLDVANDPNWQAALAASLRPGTENFRDVLAPSIDSTFGGAGRTAGGAHFNTMMRGVSDLTRNQADASAKVAADRYGAERGLQSGAATALPGVLGQQGQQAAGWLQMLGGVGAGDDAYRQRLLADENAEYDYGNRGQLDWLTNMANRYLAMYPGGQTTGTGTSSGYNTMTGGGGGGGVGSFLGPAMSLAGGAMSSGMFGGGGGGMFSDERDKTDIEELGVDPLTGLKTYAYRYKNDPKSYPKVVGPMAQDMEERDGAWHVREIGGHKVVEMKRLDPLTGLAMAA